MGNRQKRKRRQKKRERARPRVARNPGVSSLLLVNPAPAPKKVPTPAPSPASIKQQINAAVATALKERKMPKRAKRPSIGPEKKRRKKRRSRPHAARPAHAAPTVQVFTGNGQTSIKPKIRRKRDNHEFDLNLAKQYKGLVPRKGKWRGKHPSRGVRTLEAHKKSILWNLGKGSPGAQQWVLDHIPKMNPAADVKGVAKDVGVGIASFLGARVVGNLAGRLPGLSHFGSVASLGASAAATGLSYFLLGKKWPQLKKPLLFGGALALIDSIMKNFVAPHLPSSVAGVLGDTYAPAIDVYREPMGYLPAHNPADNFGCYGDMDPAEWERIHREQLYAHSLMDYDDRAIADYGDGMGIDVHEAMADDGMGIEVHEAMADPGDGLGIEVHPAQAGVDDMGAYVASGTGAVDEGEAYGAYVPTGTGAYVPSMSGMGAYVPSMSGVDPKDMAAILFGGPAGYAYALRRRRRHHPHPRYHGRFGWPRYRHPRFHGGVLPPHLTESRRDHALMGDDDWSAEHHHRHHYHHRRHDHSRHHGHYQPIHADCDIFLPHHRQHHYRRHGHPLHHEHSAHPDAALPVQVPHLVGPPPAALPAAKPPATAPLTTASAGGIFAHHD